MTTTYKFKCLYTKSKVAATPANAPTVKIVDLNNNVLVNGSAANTLSNLTGLYYYNYSGVDGLDLVAVFSTADATVDQQDLPSYTPDILTTNLNLAISAVASAVWAIATSTLTSAGTIGKLLVDNINATISSRLASASYTAPDNASIATLLGRVIGTLASGTHQPQSGDAYTVAGAIKVVTDKLATMLQAIADKWQWTTEALWLAPTGEATISDDDMTEIANRVFNDTYNPVRTLSETASQIQDDLTGDDYTIQRGDYLSHSLTGLGSLATRTKLYYTQKRSRDLGDDQSTIQVEETAGLIYINGQAPEALGLTSADATLEVTDENAGNVRWTLSAELTSLLGVRTYDYDIQETNPTGTFTRTEAKVTVDADVTRRLE